MTKRKEIVKVKFIDGMDEFLDDQILAGVRRGAAKKRKKSGKKLKKSLKKLKNFLIVIKGGPGSGHFGHAGRPPKRGGSLPGSGVGAAFSIARGRTARARQWLRSQGMSKEDVDKLEKVGVIRNFPLQWINNRAEWVQDVGIRHSTPIVHAYLGKDPNRSITFITMVRELRDWDERRQLPESPKVKGLQTQMQARLEAGKPIPGDYFQQRAHEIPTWLLPGGTGPLVTDVDVWTVEAVLPNGEIKMINARGEGLQLTREAFVEEFENAKAVIDPTFTTNERFIRGHLQVGDKFIEGNIGPFEVAEVGVDRFGNRVMTVKGPGGRQLRQPGEIRARADPFMTTGDLAPLVASVGLTQRIAEGEFRVGDKMLIDDPEQTFIGSGVMEIVDIGEDGVIEVQDLGADEEFGRWFFLPERLQQFAKPAEPVLSGEFGQRLAEGRLKLGDEFMFRSLHQGGVGWESLRNVPLKVVRVDNDGGVLIQDPKGDRWFFGVDEIKRAAVPVPGKAPTTDTPERVSFPDAIIRADVVGESTLEMMRNGDVARLDTLSRKVNDKGVSKTYVGTVADGTQVLVKDSNWGENSGEVLAYDLTHAAGFEGMVTQAVYKESGSEKGRVVRVWAAGETIKDLKGYGMLADFKGKVVEEDFEMMGILDVLGGGRDRHLGNVILTDEGRVVVIDNDFYFDQARGLGSTFQRFVPFYFKKAADRFRNVEGSFRKVTYNSATIRAAANNVKNSASIITKVADQAGNRDRRAFEDRIRFLLEIADWIDEEHGGSLEY